MSVDDVTTRPEARKAAGRGPLFRPRPGTDPATTATGSMPLPADAPPPAAAIRPDMAQIAPDEPSAPTERDRSAAMGALLAKNWWAVAVRGVAAIVFGVLALALPGVTLASLVLLFAVYMLVDGVFAIAAGARAARQGERWGLFALEGIADIAAGVIAFAWPGITILAFVYLTAAWAVITGALMVGAAIRLDQAHGRVWLALGGVVSVVFGVLLMIAPIAGALVLTWWLGVYALAFGVALLILAFRLRRRRDGAFATPTASSG